jgi:hypothetical protein
MPRPHSNTAVSQILTSRPGDSHALVMRLPRQLDDPEPVSGRLGLDINLVPAADRVGYIGIVAVVRAKQAGVLAYVEFALLVVLLARRVKLGRRGEGAPDPFVFPAVVWVRRGLCGRRDRLHFLRAGTILLSAMGRR